MLMVLAGRVITVATDIAPQSPISIPIEREFLLALLNPTLDAHFVTPSAPFS